MIPAIPNGHNAILTAPGGMEAEVVHLSIRRELLNGNPCVTSAWEPTPDELDKLAAGAAVLLSCIGHTMPPVTLRVDNLICPLCDHPITDGQDFSDGETFMHTSCLELRHAGMNDEERQALTVRALARKVGDAIASHPDYIEIRPGVYSHRDAVATCFERTPTWIPRDEKSPSDIGWFNVKNRDGSLSARYWDGDEWMHATARDGFTCNNSITHWLFVPLIHKAT